MFVPAALLLGACSGNDAETIGARDASPLGDAGDVTATEDASLVPDASVPKDAGVPEAGGGPADGGEAKDSEPKDGAPKDGAPGEAGTDADPSTPDGAAAEAGVSTCAAAPWTSVVVDQPVRLLWGGPSVAAGAGAVRIAIPADQGGLRVAHQVGAGWKTEAVTTNTSTHWVTQVIDTAGQSHILSFDFSAGQRLFEGTPGAFTSVPVAPPGIGATTGTSFFDGTRGRNLAQSPDGALHMVLSDQTQKTSFAERNAKGDWSTAVAMDVSVRMWGGIAADGADLYAVLHNTNASSAVVTVASRTGGSANWALKTLATGAAQPSITVDADHVVHVTYTTTPGADLVHAQRPPAGVWQFETVESDGNVGAQSRVVVDAAGGVHIVYDDPLNGLKEAFRARGATAWTIRVIDPNGARGDLLVDADGTTHVAYVHDVDRAVRWATRPPCR